MAPRGRVGPSHVVGKSGVLKRVRYELFGSDLSVLPEDGVPRDHVIDREIRLEFADGSVLFASWSEKPVQYSIGLKDSTWMDGVGHPHSEELRVIERMRRVDPETLQIDFTFEDPIAYTHPWNSTHTVKLVHDGKMTETVTTMSDELHYRELFLNQKPTIPIRR